MFIELVWGIIKFQNLNENFRTSTETCVDFIFTYQKKSTESEDQECLADTHGYFFQNFFQ